MCATVVCGLAVLLVALAIFKGPPRSKERIVEIRTLLVDEARIVEFIQVIMAEARRTRREEACERFEVYRHLKAPGVYIVYEVWTSQEALSRHKDSPNIEAYTRFLQSGGVLKDDGQMYSSVLGHVVPMSSHLE